METGGELVGMEVTAKLDKVKMKEMLGSMATVVDFDADVTGLTMEIGTVEGEG